MIYLIVALIILAINIVPFFMPATWTVLSLIVVTYHLPLLPLALIGVIFATTGRLILAKLSRAIVRQKFLSDTARKNIDDIRIHLEKRKTLTFGIFLFYAFSPFPTNQLFIAYGLTDMPLRLLAIPFFIGRLISYIALTFSVSEIAKRFAPDSVNSIFSGYFIVVQILTIIVVYLFTKINWHELFTKKKIKLIK